MRPNQGDIASRRTFGRLQIAREVSVAVADHSELLRGVAYKGFKRCVKGTVDVTNHCAQASVTRLVPFSDTPGQAANWPGQIVSNESRVLQCFH